MDPAFIVDATECTLLASNIPAFAATVESLNRVFSSFGVICKVRLLERPSTETMIAYVKYDKASDAFLACKELHGKDIYNTGHPVVVSYL